MRQALRLCTVLGAAALAACQTTREQENTDIKPLVAHNYLADKPARLRNHFYVKLAQGPRNAVLNDMRLGLAAMELKDDKLAEQLFDEALLSIESIYVNNPEAAKAREVFVKETIKDFKGEPYERAMTYYYRGLLYLKSGDYDNARASFKGGFIQDSFADEDQHQADFALLQYLQGWASKCRGNAPTAADDFKDFQAIKSNFPLPAPGDDTLLLVETGTAPVKFSSAQQSDGKAKFLKIRRASATETVRVRFDEKTQSGKGKSLTTKTVIHKLEPQLLEDVYFQASTRGGREFDSVLAGKASFKDAADTFGAVTVGIGLAALAASEEYRYRNGDDKNSGAAAAAGLALLLTGVIAKGVAGATEADADTRYWDNLPDRIHALTFALPAGTSSLTVDFLADDGSVVRSREAQIIKAGRCNLAWTRGASAVPANPRAPFSAPQETMYSPVTIPPLPDKTADEKPEPDRAEAATAGPAASTPQN